MSEALRRDTVTEGLTPELMAVRATLLHDAEELEANPIGPAADTVVRLRRRVAASTEGLLRYSSSLAELQTSRPIEPTPLAAVQVGSPALAAAFSAQHQA